MFLLAFMLACYGECDIAEEDKFTPPMEPSDVYEPLKEPNCGEILVQCDARFCAEGYDGEYCVPEDAWFEWYFASGEVEECVNDGNGVSCTLLCK